MMYESSRFDKALSKYRAFEYCVYTALTKRYSQCTLKNKTVYDNLFINFRETGEKTHAEKLALAESMVDKALESHKGIGGFGGSAKVSLMRADSNSPTLMVFRTKGSTLYVHVAAEGNRYGVKIEQKPDKASAL